jgi:hypothetical protein
VIKLEKQSHKKRRNFMLEPLLQQVYDAIRHAPDFHPFHEDDILLPEGIIGQRTIGQLVPQIAHLVEMNLIIWKLIKPETEPFNLIQMANPEKHFQTKIAMRGDALLDT